jgi:prepilin-type N-terminal cleavage/methylation domain-containing protein
MMEYRQLTLKPAPARALLYPYPGGSAMKDHRGFTLIEILIVIAIVAIVATIATTNFFSWQNHYSSVGFQREFLSKVNEARTRSMATSLQHRLLIDMNAETLTLQRGNLGTGTGSSGWTNVGQTVVGSRGTGIDNVRCTPTITVPTTFAFVFNPDGQVLIQDNTAGSAASPLTEAYVHISAQSVADRATIRLFGWTSKARLANGWL